MSQVNNELLCVLYKITSYTAKKKELKACKTIQINKTLSPNFFWMRQTYMSYNTAYWGLSEFTCGLIVLKFCTNLPLTIRGLGMLEFFQLGSPIFAGSNGPKSRKKWGHFRPRPFHSIIIPFSRFPLD